MYLIWPDNSNFIHVNLQEGTFADVSFQLGDTTIQAHRFILMSKCEVFYRMFKSGLRESKEGKVAISIPGNPFINYDYINPTQSICFCE